MPRSIRSRTLSAALLLFIGASSLIAWSSFDDAAHEVEELYDAHLAQQARLLGKLVTSLNKTSLNQVEKLRLLSTLEELSAQSDDRQGHPYESKVVFQVWLDEMLLLRSVNAPSDQLTDHDGGYVDETVNGDRWRVFVLPNVDSQERIIIAERQDVRGELVNQIALRSLLPELVGVPVLALLLWWAIGHGFKPLQRLAEQVRSRDQRSLQPLAVDDLPAELDTIQQAINQLLAQLKLRLEREQQFIADAAHELRTPLSILSLHTQNALTSDQEEDRRQALLALKAGIDRTTRIVSQLLTLARLDPDSSPPLQQLDPLATSRQVLAELAPLAWQQGMELKLCNDEPSDWRLSLEAGSLEILLQNLVSNALKHGSDGDLVEVEWRAVNGGLTMSVRDHGRGVAEADKQRLLERFFRTGANSGAGLGLAIAARIVERHQGQLDLADAEGGGLIVTVFWPQQGVAGH